MEQIARMKEQSKKMPIQSTRQTIKPVVIDPELTVREQLSHGEQYVFRIDVNNKDRLRDTFLVLRSSTLNQFAELLIKSMKELEKLRVVFVLMDTDFDSFFDKVSEFKIGSLLSKMFRVEHHRQVDRVLNAWYDGMQEQRFADARLEGTNLIVKSCDLNRFKIDLSAMPQFKELDLKHLQKPEIDSVGNRIAWNKNGFDIDFSTIRYVADRRYKIERDLAALEYYSEFGSAIRFVRESMNLTQEKVCRKTGFSTRHFSRVENSEQKPTAKLIEKLALAHGMSFDEYIKRLIQECASTEAEKIRTSRRSQK